MFKCLKVGLMHAVMSHRILRKYYVFVYHSCLICTYYISVSLYNKLSIDGQYLLNVM